MGMFFCVFVTLKLCKCLLFSVSQLQMFLAGNILKTACLMLRPMWLISGCNYNKFSLICVCVSASTFPEHTADAVWKCYKETKIN